ncbi:hypothetical protein KUTeg_022137 [Tegillarca granosa]|uniref:SWIM-type domain-containing protein n=1 Tax=Tegillarca granosa TaxID=220873 RepID=A0ABQ9E5C9_TEGGR|nr:hypothetical protein KUTeg_022137 [Tegillarca granosa]
MRSHEYSYHIRNEAKVVSKINKMAAIVDTSDLSLVPSITFGFVESFIKGNSKSLGTKELHKGYKYFSEKYVTGITVHKLEKGCMIRAKCYRSQKENESPHDVEVMLRDGPIIESGLCSCTIGKLGTCGHVTGLLYCLAHMKTSQMKAVPADIVKTSLPQTWHIPRGDKIAGSSADDTIVCGYNQNNPYRQPRGLRSTMYNPIRSGLGDVSDLCKAIGEVDGDCLFLSVTSPASTDNMVQTKFGRYPTGSPIGIQQKLSTHFVLNILDAEDFPPLPVKNVMVNEYSVVLDQQKCARFSPISITTEECHSIENLTRLQSLDPKWHAIRKDRITASVAGDIVKRKADNEPLVSRLKTNRRVITESMRHGLSHEAIAADAFSKD